MNQFALTQMEPAVVGRVLDEWFPQVTFTSVPWRDLRPCEECPVDNPDFAEDGQAIVTYVHGDHFVKKVLGSGCLGWQIKQLMANPDIFGVLVEVLRRADLMEEA